MNWLLHETKLLNIILGFLILVIGYFVSKRVSLFAEKTCSKRFSRHQTMLIRRCLFYILFIVFFITSLQQLGFNVSVLLGAAGVFTVAISFASQTAASNLISGIFLLFEQPFKVGDSIEVKGTSGTVDSIDLLSTKLKTSDNKLVRIPNEAMIKSEITNLSYYTTRRIDLIISVPYDCDVSHVKSLLLTLSADLTDILKDPAPQVIMNQFNHATIEIKLMIWARNENISSISNTLQELIKQRFDQEGIVSPVLQ